MSTRIADLLVSILFLIFSLYLMWESGAPPDWYPEAGRFTNIGLVGDMGPGSGFWPFWLSAVMAGACVWMIWNWAKQKTAMSRDTQPFIDAASLRWVGLITLGLFGFLVGIGVLGFYGGMFVFLLYYIGGIGRHSWLTTLLVSAAIPTVCFFFFDIAMRIVLPKGLLEPLFIPLYDIFL